MLFNVFNMFSYFTLTNFSSIQHRRVAVMGTLLESKEALRSRGLEVSLTSGEINALINNRVDSLARLAFAACPPGDAPTNDQIDSLFNGQIVPNPGTYASMKRLIFEAQTLLSAELQNKVHKTDEQVKSKLAPAERDNRIKEQRSRLEGLRFKGEEECSHQSYDLVLNMMEKDSLLYLAPEKFATRRSELAMKKSAKEIAIDQTSLIVKDKAQELTCATTTELDTTNAMRRRALAFDLVKACSYHTMNAYHAELFDHLHLQAPPGYSQVSLAQLLRADRAAWLHIAEKVSTLKRNEAGTLPLEEELSKVLAHPSVCFHLLPMPLKSPNPEKPAAAKPTAPTPKRARSRTPVRTNPGPSKGKGKGKGGKNKKGRGPNIPRGLIGKALQTKAGDRLCWAFNLPQGCQEAKPGDKCSRGVHLCAEPGCEQAHSLQNHR